MNKIIIAACFVSGISQGFSQLKKDNILLGANASYSKNTTGRKVTSSDYSDTDVSRFEGSLKAGYFLKDHFVLGLIGTYEKINTRSTQHATSSAGEATNKTTQENKLYAIGAFTRLYKPIVEGKFAFFCQLDASYLTGTSNGESESISPVSVSKSKAAEGRIQGTRINLQPGFVYFIKNRIGIEASFGTFSYDYQLTKYFLKGKQINQSSTGGLDLNFGFNRFSLGVSFYFGEKKK